MVGVHGQKNAANPLVRVVCICTVCMSSAGSHCRVFTLSISQPSLASVCNTPAGLCLSLIFEEPRSKATQ
ncbi:unnamed protein product, partial [Ectocarpus sp. 12 AP-2014]